MKTIESVIWNWTVRKGVLALIIVVGGLVAVNAQMSGVRGGVGHGQQFHAQQPASYPAGSTLDESVFEYLKVDAEVELRIKPDQIRIVLGIAESAKTSAECEAKVFQKISELKVSFGKLNIPETDVVDDFIAILPRYRYDLETREGQKVAVEKLDDFSIQSNVHIKVATEAEATEVIRAAFKLGVTDLIAVDYWNKDIDEAKKRAFEQAVADAKAKAKFLLGETFGELPQPINVKDSTRVIMPDKLYESFENSYDREFAQSYSRNQKIPVIKSFKPKNTYYKGHSGDADRRPKGIAMGPEIYVVSWVRFYYATPVAKEYRMLKAKEE